MATVMSVLVEDLEDGDLADFSGVVITDSNLLEIPNDFVRVQGESEVLDKYNVRVPVCDGYVVVSNGAEVPYAGSVYDEDVEEQYA